MFPSLLYVALYLQLGTVPLDPPSIELATRRRELGLLNLSLDRTALRTLSIWDPQTNVLRDARPGETPDDKAPVLILHLWATWCVSCKEEFPIWSTMAQDLSARYKSKVRILHIALQNDSSGMAAFVRQIQDKLPASIKYFDRSELLESKLRQAFENRPPPLPLTLILDSERIVRQAFLGSIHERRQELVDATARLVRLVNEQPAASRQPSDSSLTTSGPAYSPSKPTIIQKHKKLDPYDLF